MQQAAGNAVTESSPSGTRTVEITAGNSVHLGTHKLQVVETSCGKLALEIAPETGVASADERRDDLQQLRTEVASLSARIDGLIRLLSMRRLDGDRPDPSDRQRSSRATAEQLERLAEKFPIPEEFWHAESEELAELPILERVS